MAKLLKGGIPVAITGTTSHPEFAPNLRGLTASLGASAAQGALSGKNTGDAGTVPAKQGADSVKNALGGLLRKH